MTDIQKETAGRADLREDRKTAGKADRKADIKQISEKMQEQIEEQITKHYIRSQIGIEEARSILLDEMARLHQDARPGTERLPLLQCLGRVLAEDACAKQDQPPFPRSPLDGYALRGLDTQGACREQPAFLQVVGKIYAGQAWDGILEQGQALRLMTGAPIPEGADAVVRQEDTLYEAETGMVSVYTELKPWSNYCYAGEDYKAGEVLLKQGHLLNAGAISLLASMGMAAATVYALPGIAVYSTGDEVAEPGASLTTAKIYDSNRYYVTSRLRELGLEAVISRHVDDDAAAMADQIREASESCSLIITTGGVSVGEKDIMHDVARLLDAKILFWQVMIKPGSPTLAFSYRGSLVICLSGNPFGAIANLELLVRPVLAYLSGNRNIDLCRRRAVVSNGYAKPSGMRRFMRGYVQGDQVILSRRKQVSGAVASMAECNCLVEIEPESEGAAEGSVVWIYPM